jgi:hypothetical protein
MDWFHFAALAVKAPPLGVLAAAALLGACHPAARSAHADAAASAPSEQTFRTPARLNCPSQEGPLSKVSEAADGRSCLYRDGGREDVSLSLVTVSAAGPQSALKTEEDGLRALLPQADRSQVNISSPDAKGDAARVDLPFVHIEANDNKAHIRIFGADIKADGDRAVVSAGPGGAAVHAGPGGAEVRAGSVGDRSTDVTFVLASNAPGPNGYRAVGYIARGPSQGPLVVGDFKLKGSGDSERSSVGRLVALNVDAHTPS